MNFDPNFDPLNPRGEIAEPNYSAAECIEYAISCLKNKDSRGCTTVWLERALRRLSKEYSDGYDAGAEDQKSLSARQAAEEAERDLGNRDLDDGC